MPIYIHLILCYNRSNKSNEGFSAVGALSTSDRSIVRGLASGDTYDKAIIAEDYNTIPIQAEAEVKADIAV